MAAINASLINRCIFKCQAVLSARFDKQHEDGQMLYEFQIYISA